MGHCFGVKGYETRGNPLCRSFHIKVSPKVPDILAKGGGLPAELRRGTATVG